MRDLLDYPLGVFRSAFRTVAGWTALMVMTAIAGFGVARAIEEQSFVHLFVYLWKIPAVIGALGFSALFCPPLLGALMGTALGWYVGLIVDSIRFRIVVAVVNTAVWAAIAVWAPPFLMYPRG